MTGGITYDDPKSRQERQKIIAQLEECSPSVSSSLSVILMLSLIVDFNMQIKHIIAWHGFAIYCYSSIAEHYKNHA